MPYRKEQFVNGEIYHIVIKRIANELLFQDISDYFRGIFSIYEFNDLRSVEIKERRRIRQLVKVQGDPVSDSRDLLVEILFFCFMPNHIHLVLRQLKERGTIKFMNKIGAGYAGYFKRKYGIKEKGYFFQGRFVAVHIETEEQLKTVFVYVHANPISLIEPKWKEIGIRNPEEVIRFLEDYKWSSYPDYVGKKNFPSLTQRDFILKMIGEEGGCKNFVESWIKYKGEIKKFANLALE